MFKALTIFLFGFFIISFSLLAQEVSLTVDELTIFVGEETGLKVAVDGARSAPEPDVKVPESITVQGVGSSSSFQIINGQTSMQKNFSFILRVEKEGEFEIGPAVVVDGNNKLVSNTVKIKVVKKTAEQLKQEADYYYVETSLDKEQAYVNEQVVFSYRFYRRIDVPSYEIGLPEFTDFWKVPLGKEQSRIQVINGQRWAVTEVHVALFPLKTGQLTIDPAQLNGVIIERRGGRRRGFGNFGFGGMLGDSFFGGGVKQKRLNLQSSPLSLEVIPLPTQGRPLNFSGLVGQFDLKANLDKNNIKKGESATLTLEIHGEGNIFDAKEPEISLEGFKSYKDKPQEQLYKQNNRLSGVKVFKQALVPQADGQLNIELPSLIYFDPQANIYKSSRMAPLVMNVSPNNEDQSLNHLSGQAPSSAPKEKSEVQFIGKDLMPLKLSLRSGILANFSKRQQAIFILIGLFLPFLNLFWRFYLHGREKHLSNTAQMRKSGAYKKFKTQIGKVKNKNNTIEATSSVFKEYLGDLWNVDGGSLTPIDLDRITQNKNINENVLTEVKGLLKDYERYQYGGGADSNINKQLIEKTRAVAKTLEKGRG